MFARPESVAAYWRNDFPYALVQRMFACMPWPGTDVGRRFTGDDGHSYMSRSVEFKALDGGLGSLRPVLDQWAPKTTSLHIVPNPRHFLVFDIDLRGQKSACPEERHSRSGVCSVCWQMAQRVYDLVETITCGEFGFPAKPLPVYSGGNGVHYWCRIPPDSPWADELNELSTRRTVLMPVAIGERAARAGVKFDVDVTTVHKHMIRMPFSLHDTSRRVALPLSLDTLRAGPDAPGQEHAFAAGKAALTAWMELAL